MKEGSKVKLKSYVNHTCPEGRTDNDVSYIIYINQDTGEVKVAPELHGCKYWNKEDLTEI